MLIFKLDLNSNPIWHFTKKIKFLPALGHFPKNLKSKLAGVTLICTFLELVQNCGINSSCLLFQANRHIRSPVNKLLVFSLGSVFQNLTLNTLFGLKNGHLLHTKEYFCRWCTLRNRPFNPSSLSLFAQFFASLGSIGQESLLGSNPVRSLA